VWKIHVLYLISRVRTHVSEVAYGAHIRAGVQSSGASITRVKHTIEWRQQYVELAVTEIAP
jgi:hypothetical protein